MADTTYTVFQRTCNNWREFSGTEKIVIAEGCTFLEAKEQCKEFNDNRTEAQIEAGTMYEFVSEGPRSLPGRSRPDVLGNEWEEIERIGEIKPVE